MNQYPSATDLEQVDLLADGLGQEKDLIDFLFNVWNADTGTIKWDKGELEMHTGGWSGNEEIVNQLQGSLSWFFCWQKSERGGHYLFSGNTARYGRED